MGNSIEKAAHTLEEAGADIVGSNCGNGIENMITIAREFRKHIGLPILIQSKTEELLDAGVSIIGGCCGTTPEHIRMIRSSVTDWLSKNGIEARS